jgi:hypothetical protein
MRKAGVAARVAGTLAAGALLAGCTPEIQLATSAPFTPEWCQAAKAYPRSGPQLYNVAMCHERGVAGFANDESLVVYYLNESARWGYVEAGARLAQRGQPIPDDDLRRESAARQAEERNARILADAMRPPAPRPSQRGPQDSILFPRTGAAGPSIMPSAPRPPPVVRPPPIPTVASPGVSVRRENRSESVRRNCVNNVCRIERTVCVNGACTTTTSDR